MDAPDIAMLNLLNEVIASASGGAVAASSITHDMKLRSIGIDSLKFIMVMLELETRLGRKVFNAENIGGLETVQDVLRLMSRAQSTARVQA